ncbi:MAG: hypothetical protein U0X93_14060 [Anaerolineales bacterium]
MAIDLHTIEVKSNSPEQTRQLGERLGMSLRIGDMICLPAILARAKRRSCKASRRDGVRSIRFPARRLFWSICIAARMAVNFFIWMPTASI